MTTGSENDLERLLSKAESCESHEGYEDALRIYDGILAVDPDNPRIWAHRGYCNYRRRNYHEAVRDFSRAIELKSDVPSALYCRAESYEYLGNLDCALADFEKSAVLSPEADVFISIGLIHEYWGNILESKDAYLRALSLEPENETAANLYRSLGSENSTDPESP